jgi:signal peptidase I
MFILILIIIVINAISLLIQSAILVGTSKLFKVSDATYKKSLLITLGSFVAQFLVLIIFSTIIRTSIATILGIVASIVVFCLIIRRYYQISLGRSLGIYVVNEIFAIIFGVIIAVIVAIPVRIFLFEPFIVSGSSMSPHYNTGDYMFIEKFTNTFNRDDVIVYQSSTKKAYLIKRIIGLPNENISLNKRVLSVNNTPLNDKNLVGQFATSTINITLGSDEYFVVGDNLEHSALDSITDGPIKASQIIGKIGLYLGQIR